MKIGNLVMALLVAVLAIAGCSKADPTPTAAVSTDAGSGRPGPTGGMDEMNTLALGTLELEGTTSAVTAEQATKLLLLWQMLQGGALQGTAEIQAVVNQVKGTMTAEQMAAIEAMDLRPEDLMAWMQEQGIEMPQRGSPGGQGRQGGGPGAFGDLSEEERAQMRQELQNMTPEERSTRMAELGFDAPSGGRPGGFRPDGAGSAFGNPAIDQLVDLLSERAGQ